MQSMFRFVCLSLVAYTSASSATNHHHRCLPGSESFICTVSLSEYNPDESVPQFHIPNDTRAVRFTMAFNEIFLRGNNIPNFDALLHRQLNSPMAIQSRFTNTKTLEIPPHLVFADFSVNHINHIIVPSNQSCALRYLNLNLNREVDEALIRNISKLVNLETLHMSFNHFMVPIKGWFGNLNRLQHLTLQSSKLYEIDFGTLPPSLVTLNLARNEISAFNFPPARFPLLKYLNVEGNQIKTVDVAALLAMAPGLALFALGHNSIKRPTLVAILDELDKRKVQYYSLELLSDTECFSDERKFRGVCIPKDSFPLELEDVMKILLLVCLVGALTAGVVYWGSKWWLKDLLALRYRRSANIVASAQQ